MHKAQLDVNAALQTDIAAIEERTAELENRRIPRLFEQRRMAAEELEAWKAKFEEQKAVGARWIANGKAQLKEILNFVEVSIPEWVHYSRC